MKNWFRCWLAVVPIIVTNTVFAQQLAPVLNYEQRLEIATNILEPIRKKIANGQDPLQYELEHLAQLDPVWAANFMLERSVVKDKDFLSFHWQALKVIFSSASEIEDKKLIDLLELLQSSNQVGTYDARLVLDSLPTERRELREKVLEIAFRPCTRNTEKVESFEEYLNLARVANNRQMLQDMENRLKYYYESGLALKHWRIFLEKHWDDEERLQIRKLLLLRHAPEEFRASFRLDVLEDDFVGRFYAHKNEALTDEQKASALRQFEYFRFDSPRIGGMFGASLLGETALYDHVLALQWTETIVDPSWRFWALLAIAPTIAKHDKEEAIEIVRQCYDNLGSLEEFDWQPFADRRYSLTTSIGSLGLRFVEAIDPGLLDACIEKIVASITPFENYRSVDTKLNTISCLARYDRNAAQTLFKTVKIDPSIRLTPSYFRVQLALHSGQVWKSFQILNFHRKTDNHCRATVLEAIVPALLAKSDTEFWDKLTRFDKSLIHERVLGERSQPWSSLTHEPKR